MDTLTALHTRRSVRSYTDRHVTDVEMHTLLDAAMIAPSAGNAQPWEFIVVREKSVLQAIPGVNPYARMAAKAAAAIVVCGNLQAEKHPGFWPQDCSAATQNILLAGTAIGLGTVWTAVYPLEERVSAAIELFKLPEHVMPFSIVVLGHPASEQQRLSRFDAKKTHMDHWSR